MAECVEARTHFLGAFNIVFSLLTSVVFRIGKFLYKILPDGSVYEVYYGASVS